MTQPSPKIEMLPIASLRPYSGNARRHSRKQIRQIADSMRRFGFTNPVLVSDEGEIIAGHGRVMAAKELGLPDVPTVRLSHLTAAERRAYVIADNKLALNAGWDSEILAIEFEALSELNFDLSLTGFSIAEIDFTLEQAREAKIEPRPVADLIPSLPASPATRFGEIWHLGRHRLLCGTLARKMISLFCSATIAPISSLPTRLTTCRSTGMSADWARCAIASSRWQQARCRAQSSRGS